MKDVIFSLKVEALRLRRLIRWLWEGPRLARPAPRPEGFGTLAFRHRSPLVRDPARAEAELQHGKIHNLRLTVPRLDGTLLSPGQVFSLAYLTGKATSRAGYQLGLELRDGRMQPGLGGGRCQISNLLYWMALHLDLEILERHRHDYDIFPDFGRTQPFGSGATFFWNYLDLRVRNPHPFPIWLHLTIADGQLVGEAYTERPLSFRVEAAETDHRFYRGGGSIWRANRLWRRVSDARTGALRREELVAENRCRVLYPVPDAYLTAAASEPEAAWSQQA